MQVCSHLLHAHRLVHVPFGVWDCRVSGACSHFPLRDSTAKGGRTCTFWKVAPFVFDLSGIAAKIPLFPDHPAACAVYWCGNGACWSWPSLKICAKILAVQLNSFWVWWIQTPVVELLTPVTPAALSIQFASRGSSVSSCSGGRQGRWAAGSVCGETGVGLFPEKDWQVSGALHPRRALSGDVDEKWESGQKEWWDNPGAGHQTSQTSPSCGSLFVLGRQIGKSSLYI